MKQGTNLLKQRQSIPKKRKDKFFDELVSMIRSLSERHLFLDLAETEIHGNARFWEYFWTKHAVAPANKALAPYGNMEYTIEGIHHLKVL
jgi:hypothetical protein